MKQTSRPIKRTSEATTHTPPRLPRVYQNSTGTTAVQSSDSTESPRPFDDTVDSVWFRSTADDTETAVTVPFGQLRGR